jgi:hypothetical protein
VFVTGRHNILLTTEQANNVELEGQAQAVLKTLEHYCTVSEGQTLVRFQRPFPLLGFKKPFK